MMMKILQVFRNSTAYKGLMLVLAILSLIMTSFHLTLYSIEEDFLSIICGPTDVNYEPSIDIVLMEFQEAIVATSGDIPPIYRAHSGLPVFSYSMVIDFAIFRIYDCGHAVALFNRVARNRGIDCRPILTFGAGGGHVISSCDVEGNIALVDPLFNFIYRRSDGSFATQNEVVLNWSQLVEESSNDGILEYPIERFRKRNPKFLLNRVVDFLFELGFDSLEMFTFRWFVGSTHLFLAIIFGGVSSGLLLLYIRA